MKQHLSPALLAFLLVSPVGLKAQTLPYEQQVSFDLFQQILQPDAPENLAFSPLSISMACGMLYPGAEGKTAAEMREVFGFAEAVGQTADGFATVQEHLESAREASVNLDFALANAFWVQEDFPLLPTFQETLRISYRALAGAAQFKTNPEGERLTINNWVTATTRDRIKELLPAGSITTNTRLVLVNALYFKSPWQSNFEMDHTTTSDFTGWDGTVFPVAMMQQRLWAYYRDDERATVVALDLQGKQFAMVFLLPKGDASDWPSILRAEVWGEYLSGLANPRSTDWQLVEVQLPRFTIDYTMNLQECLKQLGMVEAFDPDFANFQNLSPSDLFISGAFHKAFLECVESGVEAAAATSLVTGITSVPPPVPRISLNRPFVHGLVEKQTGALLMLGRVARPNPPDDPATVVAQTYYRQITGQSVVFKGGWDRLSRLAPCYGMHHPWLYQEILGWVYAPNGEANFGKSIWLWSPDLGWLWTNPDIFPFVWQAGSQQWLWGRGTSAG